MQKIFNLTNKYIVLATPLILFSLISSIYLVASAGGKLISLIFAIFLFMLMTGAFIAGWFYMIKLVVVNLDSSDEPNSLIKQFPSGVGEYFLPALGALCTMLTVSLIMLGVAYFVGINFIGNPDISTETLSKAMQNGEALKLFLASLSPEQLLKINLWNFLLLIIMTLTYFLSFLYLPALFFKSKNPIKAYLISLKDLFSRKFFKSFGIFLLIFVINFLISIFSTVFAGISVIHFVITLLNFYFITLVGVGVFYYYYNNFVEKFLGQNIDVEI